MYRSVSLENKELMSLYGEERDRYFVRDEDCASEVRLQRCKDSSVKDLKIVNYMKKLQTSVVKAEMLLL